VSERVLVSGGAGFVGANLVRRLLDEGHAVSLLLRTPETAWRLGDVWSRCAVHVADLGDGKAVALAVRAAQARWIFHLAAHGAYSWETDLDRIVRTNVVGTAHLLRAATDLGVEAFVNTGSSSEYGRRDRPTSEADPLEPTSLYAATKCGATLLAQALARSTATRIVTLRLYSIYGPYEDPNRLVPALILRGLEGRLPPLVNPDIARDFVYVEDAVDAYMRAVRDAPTGAIYNVASGRHTTLRDAVEVARGQLGITDEPRWATMPGRSWDATTWVGDARRIGRDFGWSAATSFERGFALTTAWFRADPDRLALYRRRNPGSAD